MTHAERITELLERELRYHTKRITDHAQAMSEAIQDTPHLAAQTVAVLLRDWSAETITSSAVVREFTQALADIEDYINPDVAMAAMLNRATHEVMRSASAHEALTPFAAAARAATNEGLSIVAAEARQQLDIMHEGSGQ